MISPELRARIRRLFYAEHWKVGTIAAELGVHRDAVELAIESQRFVNVAFRAHASMLDPYAGFVRATLDEHPRLRATRILEMIKQRGYAGSIWPLRRLMRRIRPEGSREAFFRLTTLPGEQGQVDWGHFGSITIARTRRPLSCFVMVLSWSRAIYARFVLDQTLESFVRCHALAFEAFGGTPRQLLYDNLKTAVLERSADVIRFHPTLLELAGYYHFAPVPVARARGNEKGRVERAIRYLREAFFAARRFHSVEDLNAQLVDWIERVAFARVVPGDPDKRTVRVALEEERPRLLALAKHRFVCDHLRVTSSGKTPYLRFDGNDYSIPHTLTRKPLTLVASDTLVRVLDGNEEIARHARSWEKGRQIEDDEHLRGLASDKRRSREHRGRNRVIAACPSAEPFLSGVAKAGGHLGGTTARLLHLLEQYRAAELEAALAEATRRGAFAPHAVAHILEQRLRANKLPAPRAIRLPDDPRVRDLVVEPKSLGLYDALAENEKDQDDGD
jgi:transposase